MAVNTLTGFLLLGINKPLEALEFILIAERIVYKLIEQRKKAIKESADGHPITSLEVIGESGIENTMISHRSGRTQVQATYKTAGENSSNR